MTMLDRIGDGLRMTGAALAEALTGSVSEMRKGLASSDDPTINRVAGDGRDRVAAERAQRSRTNDEGLIAGPDPGLSSGAGPNPVAHAVPLPTTRSLPLPCPPDCPPILQMAII